MVATLTFNSKLLPESLFSNRHDTHYFHDPCCKTVEPDTMGTKIIQHIFVETERNCVVLLM
jgi:hypothetical protein